MEMKDLEKYRIFSGSTLKVLAMILMIIDHIGHHLVTSACPISFSVFGVTVTLYRLMRWVGRLSFPIFVFLLTEGFIHTHDRRKYGLNLLIFALISEIPWDLEHNGTLLYPKQNVMFTLLLGYLGMCVIEKYREDRMKQAAFLLGLLAMSFVIKADYGYRGFALILSMYVLRNNKALQWVIGIALLTSTWVGGMAFIPINMYNGQRGFIKKPYQKYLMYAVYPVHMLVLYFIKLKTVGF
jgi:hypothetical protein